MADVFQLGGTAAASHADPPDFAARGFAGNPFPASGINAGVLYTKHMQAELGVINRWLREVQEATEATPGEARSLRPLAIRGALGVGKTHLLRSLQEGLEQRPLTAVLRKSLTEDSSERLLLATLMLNSLPRGAGPAPGRPSSLPLLDRVVAAARTPAYRVSVHAALESLGEESLLASPVARVIAERDPARELDLRSWLARWLQRGVTTPSQRTRLELARPLDGEGQAIRAVADLLRLARAAGEISVWFVFVDQLEEFWRPGVISPVRRARFLTDLRFLIDLGYEGAPIAVLLAWNTETSEDQLAEEYRALWRRIGEPVDLPALRVADVWPFAEAYLQAAPSSRSKNASSKREAFGQELKNATAVVTQRLREDPRASLGVGRFAQYRVLHHWHEKAKELLHRS